MLFDVIGQSSDFSKLPLSISASQLLLYAGLHPGDTSEAAQTHQSARRSSTENRGPLFHVQEGKACTASQSTWGPTYLASLRLASVVSWQSQDLLSKFLSVTAEEYWCLLLLRKSKLRGLSFLLGIFYVAHFWVIANFAHRDHLGQAWQLWGHTVSQYLRLACAWGFWG